MVDTQVLALAYHSLECLTQVLDNAC